MDALYPSSGNILLSKISGAECFSSPQGEDEAGTGDAQTNYDPKGVLQMESTLVAIPRRLARWANEPTDQ